MVRSVVQPAARWADLVGPFAAEAAAGIVVAAAAYFLIERRLQLRRDRAQRVEINRGFLAVVRGELERNLEAAEKMRQTLPRGDLPYEAFDLGAWSLLSQAPVLAVVSRDAVQSIVDTYVRLRAANDQHALLFDFNYGSTAALAVVIAGGSSAKGARSGYAQLEKQRDDLRERLSRRIEDLEPRLRTALTAVDRELGRGP